MSLVSLSTYVGKTFLVLSKQHCPSCVRAAHSGHFPQTGWVKLPVHFLGADSSEEKQKISTFGTE